jgi:hypothetical protein
MFGLTHNSGNRRARGMELKGQLVKALLALTIAAGVVLAGAGTAGAANYPPGNVVCNPSARTVTAYPNNSLTSWYGGRETVYFKPDLYRWNGSSWILSTATAPWLRAVADNMGVLPWHTWGGPTWYWVNSQTNGILEHWTFTVAPGYYKVVDEYNWVSTGRTIGVWASTYHTNGSSGSYCTI